MNTKRFICVITKFLRQVGGVFITLSILSLFVAFMGVETQAEIYEYDDLNRVTKVIYDDQSYTVYDYDANGNIVSRTHYEKTVDDTDPGTGGDTPSIEPDTPGTGGDTPGTAGDTPESDGDTPTDNENPQPVQMHQDGMTATSKNATYVITSAQNKTATYRSLTNKKKTSYTVPNTVNIDGITYKVTKIADKAFKNNKKLKKVIIGKNITTIGKQAFYGCKNLKTIIFKTTKLKSVGKQAFKGIYKKATIKVPKKKYSEYKKLLKGKGQKNTVKIKKG